MNRDNTANKWYEQKAAAAVLFFFLPPIGIFLFWKYHKTPNRWLNTGITAIGAVWLAVVLLSIVIRPTPIESLHLKTDDPVYLETGERIKLTPTISPEEANEETILFHSKDNSIASIDKRGSLQAKKEGQTAIYAASEDDSVTSNLITVVVLQKGGKELMKQAQTIDRQIESIGKISLSSRDKLLAAEKSYYSASEKVKSFVKTESLLADARAQYDKLAREKQAETMDRQVYRTPTGKRYHYSDSCTSGSYSPISLSEAQNRGLTPCKRCAGGK